MTNTIHFPMPHHGQQIVMQHPARWKYLAAGRRWRKTTLAMVIATEKALNKQSVIWGAPTYDQVRIGWGEMLHAARGVFRFHQTSMTATSPTGGKVIFRSLDNPDNARGHTADYVIIDEVSDVGEAAWTEVLRALLIDTHGGALLLGTPKGHDWFWRESTRSGDISDAMAWQIPTRGAAIVDGHLIQQPHPLENTSVPWEEIVNFYHTMPERVFRQEILAEFLDNAGGVFKNVRACIKGNLLNAPKHPSTKYIMGVDLAKYDDYTVCVVMDEVARQVVAFHRFNLMDWPTQKQRIIDIAKQWNDAITWMDTTGLGDPIYDDLAPKMRIHSYKLTATSKRELIDNAVLLVEQCQVGFPDIPVLTNELAAYEYTRLPGGGLRMSAPQGLHDDAVVAFALACWPLQHRSASLSPEIMESLYAPISDLNARSLIRGRTVL